MSHWAIQDSAELAPDRARGAISRKNVPYFPEPLRKTGYEFCASMVLRRGEFTGFTGQNPCRDAESVRGWIQGHSVRP